MQKKIAVILTALLTTGVLAGCAGKNGTQPDVNTPGTVESSVNGTEESGTAENNGNSAVQYLQLKDVDVAQYLTFTADYKGLALTVAPRTEVTDAMAEELVLRTYNNFITADNGGITDRAVAVGDTINLDYAGTEDGVAFQGGTATGQTLTIGSGQFIPGFEDGLVGVMPGETVELNLTFPEDYNPAMAGKEVVFTVKVNFILAATVDEMADSTIATLTNGEYETVEAFTAYCREYLEHSAEYQYKAGMQNAVIAALEKIAECKEVPEGLVAKYAENIRISLDRQAAQFGVTADDFCSYYYGMDAESYAAQASEASARQAMIFQYIANEENLNISDDELAESIQKFADENGYASVDELLASEDKEELREYFMFEKVVDFIYNNAQVTE